MGAVRKTAPISEDKLKAEENVADEKPVVKRRTVKK